MFKYGLQSRAAYNQGQLTIEDGQQSNKYGIQNVDFAPIWKNFCGRPYALSRLSKWSIAHTQIANAPLAIVIASGL